MNRQQKVDCIDELKETLSRVASLVLADYRGLTVQQVNAIRSEIRQSACAYRVVKNTLVKRAIAGTPMEPLAEHFTGPTAIAYSFEDPVAPAKILDNAAKDFEHLEIKAGYVDGEILDTRGISSLAKMKGKDELRAEFLATLMAGPQSFVRLLNAAPQNFLYLLQARERAQGEG
ncbi:MAG: 50S ribosomal protein L10 [Deltaproteobacteria bacterium]|nr:50S ribosomal protein L10 [Deltaproteobacteria bacterium]